MAYATYARLRQDDGPYIWGLRGHGLTPGAIVLVRRKNGVVNRERVGHILRTWPNGAQIATFVRGKQRTGRQDFIDYEPQNQPPHPGDTHAFSRVRRQR